MTIGMNTQAIFKPSFWNERVLKETQGHGWMRIEISYYAKDVRVEPLFR